MSASTAGQEPGALGLRVFTVATVLYATMGVVRSLMYLSLGLASAAAIPIAYALIAGATLLGPFRAGLRAASRVIILTCWLVLPLLLQMTLSGFLTGSAVVLWSLAAPIGALMFASRLEANIWFVGFCVVMLMAWVAQPAVDPVAISATAVRTLFVLNLLGISLAVYLLLRYFLLRLGKLGRHCGSNRKRQRGFSATCFPMPSPSASGQASVSSPSVWTRSR